MKVIRSAAAACMAFVACEAAPVVLIEGQSNASLEWQTELAARFYGLDFQVLTVASRADGARVVRDLARSDAAAVVIGSEALDRIDRSRLLSAPLRPDGRRPALLLAADSAEDEIAMWTDHQVLGCDPLPVGPGTWELSVRPADITGELGGIRLPLVANRACGLRLGRNYKGRILAEAVGGPNALLKYSMYLDVTVHGQRLFVMAPRVFQEKPPKEGDQLTVFSKAAFLLMFLRYAAGGTAWHAVESDANLTIDDPWLIEPYGDLHYEALLREMQQHNFHTTIAFVPWNYDRSRPEPISLFKSNPDRLSIAIHGNNHYHREFREYQKEPLRAQANNIRQALARMDELRRRTGLPYDLVMIFPHEIAPEETLQPMKRNGYWATINSENVPLGSRPPSDPLFVLRPGTLEFGNFLCLKRYSVEAPLSMALMAVNLYLENPILLYGHQQFFRNGINSFNSLADYINHIAPAVQWRSLGAIIQHQYLVRSRADGDMDVLAMSPDFVLINSTARDVVFHVRRQEDFQPSPRFVMAEAERISYRASRDAIWFDVSVRARQSRRVTVSYGEGYQPVPGDLDHRHPLVNSVRILSDFRDIVLSQSAVGRWLTAVYAGPDEEDLEIGLLTALIAVGLAVIGVRRHRSSRQID